MRNKLSKNIIISDLFIKLKEKNIYFLLFKKKLYFFIENSGVGIRKNFINWYQLN